MTPLIYNVIKVFSLTGLAFFFALTWTPLLTHFLYKFKAWKKTEDRHVPRMGGLLVWLTVVVLSLIFVPMIWIPLIVLVLGSLIGLVDDFLSISSQGKGLSFFWRALAILIIGLFTGWLFYNFLNWPLFYIAFVPLVMLIIFGGAPIDGLDGLAGGVMIPMFSAYAVIAFEQGQIDLAVFSGLIAGALSAFLYFNIPPARFFLGETGMIGLLTTLVVLAFLTNSILVLPIIAFPLIVTAATILLQIFWFQVFKRKLFYCSPLHSHLKEMGWPHYKITMRYWIFSTFFAIIGMVIALLI